VSASPLLIRPKQPLTLQVCKLPRTARIFSLCMLLVWVILAIPLSAVPLVPPVTKLCQAVTPTELRTVPILPDRSLAPWESRSPMVG